ARNEGRGRNLEEQGRRGLAQAREAGLLCYDLRLAPRGCAARERGAAARRDPAAPAGGRGARRTGDEPAAGDTGFADRDRPLTRLSLARRGRTALRQLERLVRPHPRRRGSRLSGAEGSAEE